MDGHDIAFLLILGNREAQKAVHADGLQGEGHVDRVLDGVGGIDSLQFGPQRVQPEAQGFVRVHGRSPEVSDYSRVAIDSR